MVAKPPNKLGIFGGSLPMICTSPERCAFDETGGGVTRLRLVPTGVYGSDSNWMALTGALDILMRKRCTNRPRVAQVNVCGRCVALCESQWQL